MDYGFLRFLNLEYWYCLFYSLFGGRCGYLDTPESSLDLGGASISSGASASTTGSMSFGDGFFGFLSGVWHALTTGAVGAALQAIGAVLATLWAWYTGLAYTISGFLALQILGSVLGILFLRYRELSKYGVLPKESANAHPLKDRWHELLSGAMSSDPKRWRESILGADVMLGELLGALGYQGETTADKMRGLSEGAFITLPQAWEAHRIRNFVAQPSSDFILTQKEAFRVMKLYEQVFEEFKYV